jgi:hypothetical protein
MGRSQGSGGPGHRRDNHGMEFDFSRTERDMRMRLLSGRGHYETVVRAVTEASHTVWIATSNLKELMVEDGRAVPGRARTSSSSTGTDPTGLPVPVSGP